MNPLPALKNQNLFSSLLVNYRGRLHAAGEKDSSAEEKGYSLQLTGKKLQSGNADALALNPRLQSIDSAVKAHEKVHLSILGGYAEGTIQYDYIILANGEKYAVGGSIGVDTNPVYGDPEATIRKARIIRSAALGPNSPSGPDQKIAAAAYNMEMQAKQELAERAQDKDNNLQPAGTLPAVLEAVPGSQDLQPVPGNPEATIRKARTLRREAMQAGLSAQGRMLVVKSYQLEMQAHRELAAERNKAGGKPRLEVYA